MSTTKGKFAIAILAAGKGTRLKSKLAKVLHEIAGKPLMAHVIEAVPRDIPAADVICIVGHQADRVRERVGSYGVQFVEQTEQRGTGHALMMCREALTAYENVLVLSGDVPLIRTETIERVRTFHTERGAAMTILTAMPPDPFGYGRIIRGNGDEVAAIVEQKQATPEQAAIREINSGIYAFNVRELFARIGRLGSNNPHREYYLTDMAGLLRADGLPVLALPAEDSTEVAGVNTRVELATLDALLRARKCTELMQSGVTIYRPETCTIDSEVQVGPDTVIEPFVQLLGKTVIGSDCRIRSYTVLTNTQVADGVTIKHGCISEDSIIEDNAILGPYSHLRPASHVGPQAHVGNFVEMKKTRLGRGSKANHLTYLGDAEIGEGVNVGAGTITCNYDGANKFKTIIGDGAFIGSDTTLVAPVKVGKGAYIAAASCITQDVPDDSLGLTRPPQITKEGWVTKKREKLKAKRGC
ncbi:MAG TPA: bifunctional UDP-N-acetylglucosamine diphosphorylase/glucosamine-1-phosphate N-acetyltransferase GlmU [candidate division Zixibacteria bacterium]|nr:bifunctional UDP-N-acetylglucosamine diphosphorylase/glucosamine-1-phosphate N-acetyltransferase GlmU [candidate division Zixibacteria bacterium]